MDAPKARMRRVVVLADVRKQGYPSSFDDLGWKTKPRPSITTPRPAVVHEAEATPVLLRALPTVMQTGTLLRVTVSCVVGHEEVKLSALAEGKVLIPAVCVA